MTACVHLDAAPLTPPPADFEPFCEDCALIGGEWLHLRRCLECQHIACCDSSPGRHASAHVARHRSPGGHLRRAGGALALVLSSMRWVHDGGQPRDPSPNASPGRCC